MAGENLLWNCLMQSAGHSPGHKAESAGLPFALEDTMVGELHSNWYPAYRPRCVSHKVESKQQAVMEDKEMNFV
jgi:hypothetical protein